MTVEQAYQELLRMGEAPTKHQAAAYAAQVNWNRRYLRAGSGDKARILTEIRTASRPEIWHQHLPMSYPPVSCPLCDRPLPKPEWVGPGVYAAFKKALERTGPDWVRVIQPFTVCTSARKCE